MHASGLLSKWQPRGSSSGVVLSWLCVWRGRMYLFAATLYSLQQQPVCLLACLSVCLLEWLLA